MITKKEIKEIPIKRPKGVSENQWKKAKELYLVAKSKGDKFPELTVAQAALETGWFNSPSGEYNYFGQKASDSQKGSYKQTKEFEGDEKYSTKAKFRDYENLSEAVNDRIKKWGKKYSSASTPEEALYSIWEYDKEKGRGKGYATDVKYDDKIFTILGMMGVEKAGKEDQKEKESPVYGPQKEEKSLTNFVETPQNSIFAEPTTTKQEDDDEPEEVPQWKLALEAKQRERDVVTNFITQGGLDFQAPDYKRTVFPQQKMEDGGKYTKQEQDFIKEYINGRR